MKCLRRKQALISHADIIPHKFSIYVLTVQRTRHFEVTLRVMYEMQNTTSDFPVCSDLLTFTLWNCTYYPDISVVTRVKISIGFSHCIGKCTACRGIWNTAGNLHPKPLSWRWHNTQVLSGFSVIMLSNKQMIRWAGMRKGGAAPVRRTYCMLHGLIAKTPKTILSKKSFQQKWILVQVKHHNFFLFFFFHTNYDYGVDYWLTLKHIQSGFELRGS